MSRGPRPARRLDLAPLEAHVRRRYPGLTASEVAAILGVSHSRLRALRSLGLTIWHADRLAINAGTHPALIWPTFYGPQHADALALFDLDATA